MEEIIAREDATVEVPVAPAGGAEERGGIRGNTARGSHELAAAVECMASHGCGVILHALSVDPLVGREDGAVLLEGAIGEGDGEDRAALEVGIRWRLLGGGGRRRGGRRRWAVLVELH